MKCNKLRKGLVVTSLALGMGITAMPFVTIDALAKTPEIIAKATNSNTQGGVANLGKGSAKITVKGNPSQTMVGKKFGVYKLFNAENAVGMESINYTFNDEYAPALKRVVGKKINKNEADVTEYEVIDYIQTLNTNPVEGANANQTLEGRYSDFRYFIEDLRDTMVDMNMNPSVVTVTETKSDNSIDIAGLDYGYYIIDEITASEGTHQAASLCMVNTANPTADIQIKSDYPDIIKKIQEDDNRNTIGMSGWNDIADFEIGQTVPYKYETNVPNMSGYHTYYFAFHDKMDKALTFHKDSVAIEIASTKKTYKLQPSEFRIIEKNGDETFIIEIDDLKKIVDREFPEGLNNNNEGTYGQLVTLTYNATLNDFAADDTGRPGFENDVKLEFSNNPDSDGKGETGETPWDTVVCFTYKINGLKLNNHDKELAGAKFKLYSDADCKNEVFVKSTSNGYIVINRDSTGGNDHSGGSKPAEATEMVSDDKGVFTIFGLDGGTYWLKETDAPDGYRPILDPIEIKVTPTFTSDRNNYVKGEGATDKTLQTLEATAHIKQFLDGVNKEDDMVLTTDVVDGSANITVVNQVGKKLPITGSNATIIMLCAGSIMILGGLATRKKKEEKDEAAE